MEKSCKLFTEKNKDMAFRTIRTALESDFNTIDFKFELNDTKFLKMSVIFNGEDSGKNYFRTSENLSDIYFAELIEHIVYGHRIHKKIIENGGYDSEYCRNICEHHDCVLSE